MGKLDFFIVALLFLTLPLFFYRLGQSTLVSFDEAWYAEIARNILKTNDLFNLYFNGKPYYDHPPFGFWLEALTFKIFGVSEFWVRFPQALVGFSTLVVVYFLGKELFNRIVGFASALTLASSFWFIFRARSGNLDVLLTFLFLLTLLFAIKSAKDKDYLIPFVISLSLLFLTKTFIPLTIIPALVIIFWKSKLKLSDLKWPTVLLSVLVGSWFVVGVINQSDFIDRYFMIGLPGVEVETNYWQNFNQIKDYLHSGVGKWFWPGIFAVFLGLLLRQKRFYILSVFFFIFFIPFIFSARGNIWHLIPLYPVMILSFLGLSYVLLRKIIRLKVVVFFLILAVSLYVSFLQVRQMWYQFIDIPAFVSDEAILSREAGRYPYELILDEDFLPTAVFYSGKTAKIISRDEFVPFFEKNKPFLLITKQERIDGVKIPKDKYQIIKSDRDKILVLKQ